MRQLRPILLILMALLVRAETAAPAVPMEAEAIASYTIRATWDPKTHTITGAAEITWRNPTDEPVGDLWFHLYLNAFRNQESALLSPDRPGGGPAGEGEWGACILRSLRTSEGYDLLPSFRYETAEGAPKADKTVASVKLPALVPPGGTARVAIEWESRMPKMTRRSGWSRDFVFAGQWFPKLGVFEKQGARGVPRSGWNAHAYHPWTEFYADFGDYDVTLTVPDGWTVGASGLEEGTGVAGPGGGPPPGWRSHRFVARSVHDFAWTASPLLVPVKDRFLPEEWRDTKTEEVLRAAGIVEEDIALSDVSIEVLIPEELRSRAPRYVRAACAALSGYGYLLGRYPYPKLTIVVPPRGGEACGGMEYPTLITAGASWLDAREDLGIELVTVHETGHQFFYGLIASNEVEEPWLDEGMNTWMTARVLSANWGPDTHVERVAGLPLRRKPLLAAPGSPGRLRETPLLEEVRALLFLRRLGVPSRPVLDYLRDQPFFSWERSVPVPNLLRRRSRFLERPASDPMERRGFATYDHPSYRAIAYDKPALLLGTFENLFGPSVVAKTFRLWGERQRFRHPGAGDFVRTAEEAAGRELGWLFDPFLHGTGVLDYAVGRVVNREAKPPAGLYEKGEGLETRTAAERDAEWAARDERERGWTSEVFLQRLGTVSWPVEVRVSFADGSSETRSWDGRDRWTRLEFGKKVVRVEADPARRLLLDADWRNNSWAEDPSRAPAFRYWERALRWAESVLVFYRRLG